MSVETVRAAKEGSGGVKAGAEPLDSASIVAPATAAME